MKRVNFENTKYILKTDKNKIWSIRRINRITQGVMWWPRHITSWQKTLWLVASSGVVISEGCLIREARNGGVILRGRCFICVASYLQLDSADPTAKPSNIVYTRVVIINSTFRLLPIGYHGKSFVWREYIINNK